MMLLVGEIVSKLKLELKVTRVREYFADRACIRNIKTDLVETQTDQQPDETIQCRHEPLPVYIQQGETAMEPYKNP
jgi:hypothetical protein